MRTHAYIIEERRQRFIPCITHGHFAEYSLVKKHYGYSGKEEMENDFLFYNNHIIPYLYHSYFLLGRRKYG